MTFKLTKREMSERDSLAEDLHNAHTKLVQAMADYNTRMGELRDALDDAVAVYNEGREEALASLEDARDAYNSLLEDTKEFVSNVTGNAQSVFDERTDKWQDGDRGRAASDWINQWTDAEFEPVDLETGEPLDIQMLYPEELDADYIEDRSELLRDLPSEPE